MKVKCLYLLIGILICMILTQRKILCKKRKFIHYIPIKLTHLHVFLRQGWLANIIIKICVKMCQFDRIIITSLNVLFLKINLPHNAHLSIIMLIHGVRAGACSVVKKLSSAKSVCFIKNANEAYCPVTLINYFLLLLVKSP